MLPENLLLLALNDEKGTVHGEASLGLPFGLAGAVIMELALAERIALENDCLFVTDVASSGHKVLDDAVKLIADRPGEKISYWVEALISKLDGLKKPLLAVLEAKGTLACKEKRILYFFKYDVYPERDNSVEQDALSRIEAVLFKGETGTARTRLLIKLAQSCGVLDSLYDRKQRKAAEARIKELEEQTDPCAEAVGKVAKAAEAAQTAAIAAIMIASMAATTAATTAACSSAAGASC